MILRRILFGFLWSLPFYCAGFAGGMLLVHLFSSNTHDKSVEMAMTGAFVTGPLAALIGFVFGATRARRPTGRQPQKDIQDSD